MQDLFFSANCEKFTLKKIIFLMQIPVIPLNTIKYTGLT